MPVLTDIMLMPFKWGVSATYTGLDRPGPVGGTHEGWMRKKSLARKDLERVLADDPPFPGLGQALDQLADVLLSARPFRAENRAVVVR